MSTAPASPIGRSGTPAWRVRSAALEDADAIAEAIGTLLLELGGSPPPAAAMRAATHELLEDREHSSILLAEERTGLIGVLAASWQSAIHVPGRYALIQDLWVDRARRSESIGQALVATLCERARERGVARIEVGLPNSRFARLGATEAFYRREGFTLLGDRMRRNLT